MSGSRLFLHVHDLGFGAKIRDLGSPGPVYLHETILGVKSLGPRRCAYSVLTHEPKSISERLVALMFNQAEPLSPQQLGCACALCGENKGLGPRAPPAEFCPASPLSHSCVPSASLSSLPRSSWSPLFPACTIYWNVPWRTRRFYLPSIQDHQVFTSCGTIFWFMGLPDHATSFNAFSGLM